MTKRTRVFQSGSRLALWLVAGHIGFGLFAGVAAHAETSVTNTVSGTTNTTNLVIGNAGNFNYWTVTNGAQIVNTGGLIIGTNTAVGNVLLIDGGVVTNVNEFSLGFKPAANNNSVLITNGGKLFTGIGGATFFMGRDGSPSNSITVVGGAGTTSVWDGNKTTWQIGYAQTAGLINSYNTITVGAGGVITNAGNNAGFNLGVGIGFANLSNNQSFSNRVVVTDGGKFFAATNVFVGGWLGNIAASGSSVNSNQLWIANTGMVSIAGGLYVGSTTNGGVTAAGTASFNNLTITNGGQLFTTGRSGIGFNSSVAAGGAGRTISNTAFIVGSGVSGTATSLWDVGNAPLVIGGAHGAVNSGFIADFNTVTVDGRGITGGAVLTNIGNLSVSYSPSVSPFGSSAYNSLVVSNGGQVFVNTGETRVGDVGRYNNSLLVDGGTFVSGGTVFVGLGAASAGGGFGGGNSLLVSNGASVSVAQLIVGGYTGIGANQFGGSNNMVTVAGTNPVTGARAILNFGPSGGNLTIGQDGATNNSVLVGAGGVITNAGVITVGRGLHNYSNSLSITGGGFVHSASAIIGSNTTASGNYVLVTGFGSTWSNAGALSVGLLGSRNRLIISNGGVVVSQGGNIGNPGTVAAGTSNSVTVTGNNSLWTIAGGPAGSGLYVGGGVSGGPGGGNQLTISDGGQVNVVGGSTPGVGGLFISAFRNSSSNTVTVTGNNSLLSVSGDDGLYVGWYVGGTDGTRLGGNQLIITNGGRVINTTTKGLILGGGIAAAGTTLSPASNSVLVSGLNSILSNTAHLVVGNYSVGNTVTISNGGAVYVGGNVTNGTTVSGGNNRIILNSGGLLEANTLINGAPAGNIISNNGGIYQFTTAPTVTPNGAGRISITDGTLSFRGTTNASVAAISGLTYAGANTFRLNAASNTAATAGSQTYNFQVVGSNPTNYTRLEMLNGHTAYDKGNLTIGATGTMLVSNTTATITGVFTNSGSLSFVNARATFQNRVVNTGTSTMLNSVGTFNTGVINSGHWATDPTTNIFQGFGYTNTISGAITMTAGDVYVFTNTQANVSANFINVSTNNFANDMRDGKFLFSGGLGLTQTFTVAGQDLGPAAATATSQVYSASLPAGYADNFALGTLEISNFSTVRVTDAFIDLTTAGLYLENLFLGANSLLIIDPGVQVYFRNSNTWTSANFLLEGNPTYDNSFSGLHQIVVVPEPSVFLLCLAGGGIMLLVRRRSRR